MKSWFARDTGLKIISLILAIGLWYYAVGEEGIEITRTVPLKLKVHNQQMSVLSTSAETIQVTLMAPRSMLSKIASEEITASHEIGSEVKTAGEYSFRLEPREVDLPTPYIRVVKMTPEVVQVTLDELITQKLEVKPQFSGEPAFGYKVQGAELELNPNAVLIQGPKAQLEKFDVVKTKPIDLVGRIRSFRRNVELELPSNVKTMSEALIDVFVPIKEEFDEKLFEAVPVRILKAPTEERLIELMPDAVTFTLKGSARKLEKLDPQKMMAFVDVSSLENGTHEIPVELVLPEEVSLKEGADLKVKVTLAKSKG